MFEKETIHNIFRIILLVLFLLISISCNKSEKTTNYKGKHIDKIWRPGINSPPRYIHDDDRCLCRNKNK